MSLAAAIHQQWASFATLTRQVPSTRFLTGLVPPVDADSRTVRLPYVALDAPSADEEVLRSSSGTRFVKTRVTFNVYAETLDAASEIAEAVGGRFERAGFAWREGEIQDMRQVSRRAEQASDGSWRISAEFDLRYTQLERRPLTRVV